MTQSDKHVILNGVNYFLDEGSEGRHFVEDFELLIPPPTGTVQGDETQLRPDLLRWGWTDWSGGAGQDKWDPRQHGRYFDGVGVDGWTKPGFAMAAPYLVPTKNSGGSVDISFVASTDPLHVLPAPGGASALIHQDDIYLWSTDRWAAAAAITGVTGNVHDADSDERYIWMVDNNSIIRRDGAGAYVDFATDIAAGDDQNKAIVSMKNNVYVIYHNASGITVDEYVKSGTPPVVKTTIYTGTQFISSTSRPRFRVCKSHNRIYIAVQRDFLRSEIIEIILSSAAGGGYGREIGDMPMVVEGLSWHAGLLYAYSKQGPQYSPEVNLGTIMYLQPLDGTYGIVDVLRRDDEIMVSGTPGPLRGWIKRSEAINLCFFAVQNDATHGFLGLCDTISGAIHTVSAFNALSSTIVVSGVALLPGPGVVVAVEGGKVYRLMEDRFESTVPAASGAIAPYIISPLHNFGLAEQKVINSFRLTAEVVPTNWSVQLQYEADESGTWVTAGSIVAGERSKELVLAAPATFYQLRMRLNFVYTGGVPATTTPIISSVEAWSTLARYLHTWTLLLNMASDRSQTGAANVDGTRKAVNLRTLAGTGASFAFSDFYTRREGSNAYVVTMASCQINETKQAEGTAAVRLVEVQ